MWRGHFYGREGDQTSIHSLWLQTGNLQGPSLSIETSSRSRGGMQRWLPPRCSSSFAPRTRLWCFAVTIRLVCHAAARSLLHNFLGKSYMTVLLPYRVPQLRVPSAYSWLTWVHLQVADITLYRGNECVECNVRNSPTLIYASEQFLGGLFLLYDPFLVYVTLGGKLGLLFNLTLALALG